MVENRVGILGARSVVGKYLLSNLKLSQEVNVIAVSRKPMTNSEKNILWQNTQSLSGPNKPIESWISLVPIWILPKFFPLMKNAGVKKIVALSSTSLFTKKESSSVSEQKISEQFRSGEEKFQKYCEENNISWIILRPTLIYGNSRDRNLSEIVKFIRRFGFFPLFGEGRGLRQPIHGDDVAKACLSALHSSIKNKTYNISGAEIIPYRNIVEKLFQICGKKPKFLPIPLGVFKSILFFAKFIPRFSLWTSSMAERMNQDLVFDHSEAKVDFQFSSKSFLVNNTDYQDV